MALRPLASLVALVALVVFAWTSPGDSGAECGANAPDWPPAGSSWTSEERRTGSFGSGTTQVTTVYLGERPWNGRRLAAVREDSGEVVYFDRAHRVVARIQGEGDVITYEPYDPVLAFPLAVGRRWSGDVYVAAAGAPGTPVRRYYRVEAYEELVTPAGRLNAFKVAREDAEERVARWWSPLLGIVVRHERVRTGFHPAGRGTIRRELVKFSPAIGEP